MQNMLSFDIHGVMAVAGMFEVKDHWTAMMVSRQVTAVATRVLGSGM
jgi:hypothetical protein